MRDFRLVLRLILPLCLLATAWSASQPACLADEPPLELPKIFDGELPQNVLPLTPDNELAPEAKIRSEAAAHFMHGVLLERRGEFDSAGREYAKAIELAPAAIEVYRTFIQLRLSRNEIPAALTLLVEALKHAPADFELLSGMGQLRQKLGQLPEAIEAFEQASESPQISKNSQEYVLLMAQLAELYQLAKLPTKTADAFQVIFEAKRHPERFELSPQALDLLRSVPVLSFEIAGIIFLEDKRYELALEAFELAEKNPRLKAEEIKYYKAEIYQSQGKPEEALASLQPYLDKKMQSRGVAPYQLLAEILKSLKREDEIEPTLDAMYEANPGNNFVIYALASLYQQKDQTDKAIDLYLKAIGRGADPEGYQGLMDIYYSQGKASEWLGALSGLLGLGREVEGIEEQFKQVSDDTEFMDKVVVAARELKEAGSRKFNYQEAEQIGRLAMASKRTEYVEEFYLMAMEFRPTQRPQLTRVLALYLLQQEEYARTESLMENALKQPEAARFREIYAQILTEALWRLSYDLDEAGERETALAKIKRAEEIVPGDRRFRFRRGWLEYRTDHTETAISIFRDLIENVDYASLQEGSTAQVIAKQSHFLLSAILVQQGKMSEGEKLLEVIYNHDPNDPSVNNDLGYLYADQNKKLEQAEKMIRLALAAEPENHAYLDSMAWVLYRRGKLDEALKYMLKAVEGSEAGDSTLWDHLGDIYEKMGQTEKALESWQTALKQAEADDPRDEELIGKIRQKLGLPAAPQPLSAPKPAQPAR